MARIRTIKPEFFKNEELAELPAIVRLLFIGLWTQADKEGRLLDRPKRIKAELFPYDSIDIDKELSRLQSAGFIKRYEVGELKVIHINTFTKHQRIQGNEAHSESALPVPPKAVDLKINEEVDGNNLENLGNTLETPENTGREGKGRERKGKEGKGEPPPLNNSETKDLELEIHHYQVFVMNKCPTVMKMDRKLSLKEAIELEKAAVSMFKNNPDQEVEATFLSMENKKTLLKDYSSAYLTCLKWLKIKAAGDFGKINTNRLGNDKIHYIKPNDLIG